VTKFQTLYPTRVYKITAMFISQDKIKRMGKLLACAANVQL